MGQPLKVSVTPAPGTRAGGPNPDSRQRYLPGCVAGTNALNMPTPSFNAMTTVCPPSRRTLSGAGRASAEAYRRRLKFEIDFMDAQRQAKARGCAVRDVTLAAYPAARELVHSLANRVAAGSRIPPSGVMLYRGARVRVSLTNFGRVFVSTLDGRPIGASSYGAVWDD